MSWWHATYIVYLELLCGSEKRAKSCILVSCMLRLVPEIIVAISSLILWLLHVVVLASTGGILAEIFHSCAMISVRTPSLGWGWGGECHAWRGVDGDKKLKERAAAPQRAILHILMAFAGRCMSLGTITLFERENHNTMGISLPARSDNIAEPGRSVHNLVRTVGEVSNNVTPSCSYDTYVKIVTSMLV